MVDRSAIFVIREQLDAGSVLRNFDCIPNIGPVVVERSVLYPYIAFTARCKLSTMIGTRTLSFDCLVDAVNGHAATADAFVTREIRQAEGMQLHPQISEDAAKRAAQRTATHRLSKKLRMIAPFDVQLESGGVVYKRFWIVRVGADRVMMDSVTGNAHPLPAHAA